jgi:restriction endonuclease Mrr
VGAYRWFADESVLGFGRLLARLMVDHDVGLQVANAPVLKRLDEDYFDAL